MVNHHSVTCSSPGFFRPGPPTHSFASAKRDGRSRLCPHQLPISQAKLKLIHKRVFDTSSTRCELHELSNCLIGLFFVVNSVRKGDPERRRDVWQLNSPARQSLASSARQENGTPTAILIRKTPAMFGVST
ncbi:hypothetical protein PGT21_021455 [Puccinia graminis f. sp. tritici]|uniref:Uncharacterized protein n=1 Tax=Puccinia graminis f. sp. tritici TaxID=56615 RepID=A0A5B0R165_PUCGR|nr:hypothetical protein PGT21_010411 [Puccinia graminis f. sp. tritici]KAA1119301.1 hypothetical protein PGT21_021455 [Puccinia graminis f. sp. tritici]